MSPKIFIQKEKQKSHKEKYKWDHFDHTHCLFVQLLKNLNKHLASMQVLHGINEVFKCINPEKKTFNFFPSFHYACYNTKPHL